MNIWIDGFEANVPQRVGSSQVAFELLRNLEKLDHKNNYTILLASSPLEDLPKERSLWRYKYLKIKRLKTYIGIPLAVLTAREKPDLFFSPTHYAPSFITCRKIITVFDLSFLRFPQYFKKKDLYQLKNWTKKSVKAASSIITISESSKKDIEQFYGVSQDRITVAYPGYDQRLFKPVSDKDKIAQVKNKYGIGDNYIIYIGTIQPRKNLVRLIQAFKDIKDLKLVIVGKTKGEGRNGWMYQETLLAPSKYKVEEKVIFTGFVPNEDLPYLLSGAMAFILPSLFEGFGIPALEAMAVGTPTIVSDVSSLPEVIDGAGLLVDPNSTDEIALAIKKISSDQTLRKELSKKGLLQAKKFSWEKMAKKVLEVFEGAK